MVAQKRNHRTAYLPMKIDLCSIKLGLSDVFDTVNTVTVYLALQVAHEWVTSLHQVRLSSYRALPRHNSTKRDDEAGVHVFPWSLVAGARPRTRLTVSLKYHARDTDSAIKNQ